MEIEMADGIRLMPGATPADEPRPAPTPCIPRNQIIFAAGPCDIPDTLTIEVYSDRVTEFGRFGLQDFGRIQKWDKDRIAISQRAAKTNEQPAIRGGGQAFDIYIIRIGGGLAAQQFLGPGIGLPLFSERPARMTSGKEFRYPVLLEVQICGKEDLATGPRFTLLTPAVGADPIDAITNSCGALEIHLRIPSDRWIPAVQIVFLDWATRLVGWVEADTIITVIGDQNEIGADGDGCGSLRHSGMPDYLKFTALATAGLDYRKAAHCQEQGRE